MQTANSVFSSFLAKNADQILDLCLAEGFTFRATESPACVTVRCTLPSGYVRYIIFDDHQTTNAHGGKPHVCNQWHKGDAVPISYEAGKDITETERLQHILRATAIMCLTQSDAYNDMKARVFS